MPGKLLYEIAAVREAVRTRVAESSMRVVAEEIGISRGGLDSFLSGREPYRRTRARLMEWQVRRRAGARYGISDAEIDAAVAVLREYIEAAGTEKARERRRREVVGRVGGG
jgi:hypothetical protein